MMSPLRYFALRSSHGNQQATPKGFTLVEVLIALSLTVMLLGIVWNSISTYRDLQQKAERRATELRLVRGLTAQVRDDLLLTHLGGAPEGGHLQLASPLETPLNPLEPFPADMSAPAGSQSLPPPQNATEPNTTTPPASTRKGPDRNAGLRGGSTWLVIDISVPTTFHAPALPTQSLAQLPAPTSEIPQWQRIAYFFAAPAPQSTPNLSVAFPDGLHRVAIMPAHRFDTESFITSVQSVGQVSTDGLDSATSISENIETFSNATSAFDGNTEAVGLAVTAIYDPRRWLRNDQLASLSTTSPMNPQDDLASPAGLDELSSPQSDTLLGLNTVATTEVTSEAIPEIAWCRFRYFDGQSWQDAWDSRQKKSLPTAISLAYVLVDDVSKAASAQSERDTIPDVNAQMASSLADDLGETTVNTIPLSEPLTITLPAPAALSSTLARETEIDSPVAPLDDTFTGNQVVVPIRQSVFSVAGSNAPPSKRQAAQENRDTPRPSRSMSSGNTTP